MGIDKVAELASRLKERPTDASVALALRSALGGITDARLIRTLAQHYEAELEIGVELHRRLLELDPRDVDSMTALASLYSMHLKPREAQHWATEVLKIDPANTAALYAMLMSQAPEDLKERERLCRAIVTLAPNATVERELAEILCDTGRADEARRRLTAELDRLRHTQPESDQTVAIAAALRAISNSL